VDPKFFVGESVTWSGGGECGCGVIAELRPCNSPRKLGFPVWVLLARSRRERERDRRLGMFLCLPSSWVHRRPSGKETNPKKLTNPKSPKLSSSKNPVKSGKKGRTKIRSEIIKK
jgi:hypothetical protein